MAADLELVEDNAPLLNESSSSSSSGGSNVVFNRRGPDQPTWRRCFCRRIILVVTLITLTIFLTLVYFWQEEDTSLVYSRNQNSSDQLNNKPNNTITYDELMQENFEFDISGYDVMVFLHIQKTGGTTFGKHLVEDLDLERDCECHRGKRLGRRKKLRCDCFRPGIGEKNWLFSRYSTGWKCGLHPDWTELTGCVDTYLKGIERDEHMRRYFYITFLRNPVNRYLSEFRHVQRGATWKTATNMCGGRSWASYIPKCYQGEDWMDVELEEFMQCPFNLAVNRQTRMLADLELVHCYNKSAMDVRQREHIMLSSAKANLERMAYFGVTEQQKISQYLFEETFNLQFRTVFEQINATKTHSSEALASISPVVLDKISQLNRLDEELYQFATQLLQSRFDHMKTSDTFFKEHMARLENAQKVLIDVDTMDDNF